MTIFGGKKIHFPVIPVFSLFSGLLGSSVEGEACSVLSKEVVSRLILICSELSGHCLSNYRFVPKSLYRVKEKVFCLSVGNL